MRAAKFTADDPGGFERILTGPRAQASGRHFLRSNNGRLLAGSGLVLFPAHASAELWGLASADA